MMDEGEARIVAKLDQFAAWTRETASCVALYWNQLIEDGVPEPLAAQLTVDYQQVAFGTLEGDGGAEG